MNLDETLGDSGYNWTVWNGSAYQSIGPLQVGWNKFTVTHDDNGKTWCDDNGNCITGGSTTGDRIRFSGSTEATNQVTPYLDHKDTQKE